MTLPIPNISVIIPAYNEESRLPNYLCKILSYFELQEGTYEILVVDDASTDATAAMIENFIAKNKNIKLVRLPDNRGKGYAVKVGMLQARGKLRLFTDADGATPITELDSLKKAIAGGIDVAVASRALNDDTCLVEARSHRKIIGTIFNTLVHLLVIKGIKDTQCGFKLFTDESAMAVFPLQRVAGFGFDVEILFLCREKGLKIAEIPVNWTDIHGSKVKLFGDSFRMFVDISKVRIYSLRGFYQIKSDLVKSGIQYY